MTILINTKNRSQTIEVLARFLNYNLCEIDHGLTFDAIFITLIEKAKKTQKFKRNFLYKKYADISIPFDFTNRSELDLVDFNNAFETIIEHVDAIDEIVVPNKHFHTSKFKADLIALRPLLPKTQTAMSFFIENAGELDRAIILKGMNGRATQRQNNKRDLNRKLKEFIAFDNKHNKSLRPYLNIITGILTKNLKLYPLYAPVYEKIYFNISDTLDDAKINCATTEDWHEYTYAALDYDKFDRLDISNRLYYLADIFSVALDEIGRIDHLDQASIEGLKAKLKEDLNTFLTTSSEEQIASELRPYPRR